MARSVPQQRTPTSRGRRYSLRTLFFVSIAIAVPFLVLANLRHSLRPEESVASPLYLLLGIAVVVLAAGIGSAIGNRTGMYAAVCMAAFSWIGVIYLCGLFSKELMAVLPAHALFAVATVGILVVVVRSIKTPEQEGPHDKLLQLLKVKRDVQEAQHAKHPESTIAEPNRSANGGPKSKIQT